MVAPSHSLRKCSTNSARNRTMPPFRRGGGRARSCRRIAFDQERYRTIVIRAGPETSSSDGGEAGAVPRRVRCLPPHALLSARTVATAVCGIRRARRAGDDHDYNGTMARSAVMTSLMIGRLVEAGVLHWGMIRRGPGRNAWSRTSALREVTLLDLLAHRAGLPADPSRPGLLQYLLLGGNPEQTLGSVARQCVAARRGRGMAFDIQSQLQRRAIAIADRPGLSHPRTGHVLDPLELCGAGFTDRPACATPIEHR